jgi:hypothetical protein
MVTNSEVTDNTFLSSHLNVISDMSDIRIYFSVNSKPHSSPNLS